MKKKIKFKFLYVILFVITTGSLMSFTAKQNLNPLVVPSSWENKLLDWAIKKKVISANDRDFVVENHVVQKCIDAFVASGYKPSAAVDKLAEYGVSSGKYSSKAEVKTKIKATIEKERKKESNWKLLYKTLGL